MLISVLTERGGGAPERRAGKAIPHQAWNQHSSLLSGIPAAGSSHELLPKCCSGRNCFLKCRVDAVSPVTRSTPKSCSDTELCLLSDPQHYYNIYHTSCYFFPSNSSSHQFCLLESNGIVHIFEKAANACFRAFELHLEVPHTWQHMLE